MAENRYRDYDRRSDYRTEERPGRSQSIFSDDGDRSRGRDDERGFIEKAGDEIRSWFGDEDGRRDRDRSDYDRSLDSGGMSARGYGYGDRHSSGGRDTIGARSGNRHDEHYRQWRDRQIAQFDRDYEDYCRERQDRFEQDFASWRSEREQQQQQRSGTPSEGRGATTGESRLKDKAVREPATAGASGQSRGGRSRA